MDNLPDGHISVEDAIKLLSKHTKGRPVVDLQFLVDNLNFMNSAKNFTIKLLQQDKNGKYYSAQHVVAVVKTGRDLENLKFAIKETAERVNGEIPEPEKKVKAITSQVDGDNGNTSKPRVNTKSKAKYGKKIESGHLTVNSADEV